MTEPYSLGTVQDRMEVIAPLIRGRKVLDLGVVDSRRSKEGTAERLERQPSLLFRRICQINADAQGVDIDEEGVAILRSQGFNVRTADVTTMDLAEQFDVVIAGEIIEHLPSPGQFLRNARNHLRPEGTLVISTPNPFYHRQFWRIWRCGRPRVHDEHTCWFDPMTLSRLCRLSGLQPYALHWVQSERRSLLETWPQRLRRYFSGSFMMLARPA